jgi:hypothetical protein
MRISPLLLWSLIVAIAVASLFIWFYPSYILDHLNLAPTGITLREFYKAKTIFDLPPSIQELMKYQYPLAILLALGGFGAIYFGLESQTSNPCLIIITCLYPIATFVIFPLIFLSPLISFGLLIWLFWRWKSTQQSLIPELYCFAIHSISAIVLWLHLQAVFLIIA